MDGKQRHEGLFPAWGPYSKTYMGLSHLPALARPGAQLPLPLDARSAARFDCVVVPMLHSSQQPLPNTTRDGACHPFVNMASDLSRVHYRWQLGQGPRESAYAEVEFVCLDGEEALVRTTLVNNTDQALDCVINYFFTLDYPQERVTRVKTAPGTRYIPGERPAAVNFARPRPWDAQQPDAAPKGVFRDPAFTDGFGFGDRVSSGHVPHLCLQPWGLEAGDSVSYQLPAEILSDAEPALAIRYQSVPARPTDGVADFAREALGIPEPTNPGLAAVGLEVSGALQGIIELPAADSLRTFVVPAGHLKRGQGNEVRLRALGAVCGLEIDGLLLGAREAVQACRFEEETLLPAPVEVIREEGGHVLDYPGQPVRYGFTAYDARVRLRHVYSGTLEDAEPMRLSNPHFSFDDLQRPFSGSFRRKQSSPGHWVNLITPGVVAAPHSRETRLARLRALSAEAAPGKAENAPGEAFSHILGLEGPAPDSAARAAFEKAFAPVPPVLPGAPEDIQLGMGILRATLLQNLVYPIYTKQGWICHFTPGKRWDNLYTWDGGFIALGLMTASPALAEYMLGLYLAPLDDPEQAFVHHGSPVPVQFMALRELVAAADPAGQARLLARYYGRARLFYEFLLGRTHGSTTAKFETGLLTTYDYFYSAHGMDDYPAQLQTHLRGLAGRVAPAITSSQAILAGRSLALLAARYAQLTEDSALRQGLEGHIREYERDMLALETALEEQAWDEASGFYAYVVHDGRGKKTDILRDDLGGNLDRGFDGLYPLAALGGAAKRQDRLLAHLMSEGELLTPYGLTAVSQKAPYFTPEGYWNGAVWFSHAWYFGRALLDYARGDFLLELVGRQLKAFSAQAVSRWNSYEMLRLTSGQGAWHPTFSGLTSPLLNWASSLYVPGTLTTGLAALVLERREEGGLLHVLLRHHGRAKSFQLWLAVGDESPRDCRAALAQDDGQARDIHLLIGPAGKQLETPEGAPVRSEIRRLSPGLVQVSISL